MSTTKFNQAVLAWNLLKLNFAAYGNYGSWVQNIGRLIFYIISQNNSQFSPTDTGTFTKALERAYCTPVVSPERSRVIDESWQKLIKLRTTSFGTTTLDDVQTSSQINLDQHDLAILYKMTIDIDPFNQRQANITSSLFSLLAFILQSAGLDYNDSLWYYLYNKQSCLVYPNEADSRFGEITWNDVRNDYADLQDFTNKYLDGMNFRILSNGDRK